MRSSIIIKTVTFLLCLCLILGAVFEDVSAQSDALVRLQPVELLVGEGKTAAVEVWVEDVEDLYGLDIRLDFDPAVVEVVDADEGTDGLQIQPGELLNLDFVLRNTADNESGTAWFALTQVNPSEAASGEGIAFSVTFRGKEAGASSSISITYAKLVEPTGAEIPAATEDGEVRVVAPEEAPEEPTKAPTRQPTLSTPTPTEAPDATATEAPSETEPTATPTAEPTSEGPTSEPTAEPTTANGTSTPTGSATPEETRSSSTQEDEDTPSPGSSPAASRPRKQTESTEAGERVETEESAEATSEMLAATGGESSPTPTAQSLVESGESQAQSPRSGAQSSSDDSVSVGLIVAAGLAGILGVVLLLAAAIWALQLARRKSA